MSKSFFIRSKKSGHFYTGNGWSEFVQHARSYGSHALATQDAEFLYGGSSGYEIV
jgi:hypothetical protein